MDTRQEAALIALGQSALKATDLPSLLDHAARLLATTLEVEYTTIWELLADGSGLVLRTSFGWQHPGEQVMSELGTRSAAGYALLTGTPVLVVDWCQETRFSQPPLLRDRSVLCSLYITIQGHSQPFGVLGGDSTQYRSFTDEHVHFVQAVAGLLAVAIERIQAEESLRMSEARFRRLAENAADITERREAYQTLDQRVEERTHELERRHMVAEGFHTILTILNSNRGLNEILDHIIVQACQLLGAPTGAIYRLNQQRTRLEIRAAHGMSADEASLNLPLDCIMVDDVVMRRQPIAITDTALLWRTPDARDLAPQSAACLTLLAKRYGALLAVPLIIKDDVYGALALYYPQPRLFCDEEIRLATAMSDQAALAIENARLLVAAQGKAVLEERQRLARDLHDSVTQSLYGITLYAEAATRLLVGGDVATVASHLSELQDTAQEALQEMRRLIFELRPPVLEEAGLVAALQTRLETVEERSHLGTTLIVDGTFKVPEAIEEALYRIAQEALNNVLKHARAGHVMITLQHVGSMATLEIADDGIGFDPAQAQVLGGLGLRGMAERVTQLGGRLLVQSTPGSGTQVRVEICL